MLDHADQSLGTTAARAVQHAGGAATRHRRAPTEKMMTPGPPAISAACRVGRLPLRPASAYSLTGADDRLGRNGVDRNAQVRGPGQGRRSLSLQPLSLP